MNCQKFESVASELARGQMMEVELRDEAMAHSENCSSCATQLRDEEMLSRGLRSLATEMDSFEAPAELETNLMNAFRHQQVVVPMPLRRDYRRYWVAAVAALLLIVFSAIAFRVQTEKRQVIPQREARQDVQQDPRNEEPKQQFAMNEDPQPEQQIPSQPKKHRRLNPALLQANSVSARNRPDSKDLNHAEVATEFMPLGYLNAEAVQDGGQIVRVEMPRTALVKFGIPVNMDRANERVKADILLGVDGMAHAIRFVQDRAQ